MLRAFFDRPGPAAPGVKVPSFARWTVLPIVAVTAIAHFVASFGGGYWFDEVYMLAIGRNHLDWGSADQPVLTPLLAAVMDWLVPGSIVALRIPAVLATAAAVIVAALIARELGGDRRAQTLTAGAQATALWSTLTGHWLTPYTLEPVQWLALAWLVIRWIRLRDDRLLLALGVVVGIAAETKFQVLLLCAVLILGVVVFGPRELLRRPLLWVGAGIALFIALPALLWQAANGWPQLQIGAVVASETEELNGGRPVLAVALIILPGIAGTVLSLYGLWCLVCVRQLRSYRFLAVTFIVLYLVFVVTAGRIYYLNGLYGILAAVGALGLQHGREAGRFRWRWIAWPAYAASALAAISSLAVAIQTTNSPVGAQIAERTADAYRGLPADQREHTAIMGQSYIVAAYIDAYSSRGDVPTAHSSNRGYGYFAPPSEKQTSVLYVGTSPDELRPYVTSVRKVADGGKDASVWLCSGRRAPWNSFWRQLRHLTVGDATQAGLGSIGG